MFIFDVKWFKVVTTGAHASVRRDKSGLIQVDSTKIWTDARDTFVRPEHCEQVVFKSDPKDPRWLFVVQVAPRSKSICEGLEVQASEQVDHHQHEEHEEQPNEEHEEQPNEEHEEQPNEEHEEQPNEEHEEQPFEEQPYEEHEEQPGFNDDDAEMHLEIDLFGATDLEEDDRIDDDL